MVAAALTVLMICTMSTAAFAFNDVEGEPQEASILALKERGIVGGMGDGRFAPQSELAVRDAVVLIVKALNLNLAAHSFIKQPLASDAFDQVPDDAWYADAFVIAHVHGVLDDRNIDPNGSVKREQFVQWVMNAVNSKGSYAWIDIYHEVNDEADIADDSKSAVQQAITAGIINLDDKGNFRPQDAITRGEAAAMTLQAIEFVERHPDVPPPAPIDGIDPALPGKPIDPNKPVDPIKPVDPDPIESGEITPSVTAAGEGISKITLDMGERPHPGWGVWIEGIDFIDKDSAIIRYSVSYPDPDMMYPMVIVYPKAEAYIASDYTDIEYQLVKNNSLR